MSAPDSVNGSFVPEDTSTPAEQYSYDSIVPSGVNLGSLGGIMSTDGPGLTWDKLTGLAKSLLTGKGTPAQYAGLATLAAGLMGANKPSGSPGWRGTINPNKYTFQRRALPRHEYVPYSGRPVMGRQNFESTYVQKAADGGIMGLAHGGKTKDPRYLSGNTDGMADKISTSIDGEEPAALSHGEFVIPADVVSHLGNGNSEAGAQQLYKMMDRIRMARTGTKKQGKRIDPEKFMAGGESGYAGGGIVSFAEGGTAPAVLNPTSKESNLSEWAAPGVTNYLEKGMALANQPYQAYTGPLTAGYSPLQQQVFNTAAGLETPAAMGQAQNIVRDAGTRFNNLSYSPTAPTNQYSSVAEYNASQLSNPYTSTGTYNPLTANNQYSSVAEYNASQLSNPYTSTGAYNPLTANNQYTASPEYNAGQVSNLYTGTSPYTAGSFTTGSFDADTVKQYMNPYIELALNPQLDEARRQAQITQMGNAAKAAAAGAFGGSRAALMDTETQRNLAQQLAQITGQGYNTAYNTALDAFKSQQGLGLQAQQAAEASRQFGASQALANAQNAAQYGLAGFSANEQAKLQQAQLAAQQAAQRAQYGQAAQQLTAQERQFGASQALSNAQNAAQYGLASFEANERARQQQAQQAQQQAATRAQYGQAAQQLGAQERQFGANLGLSGLQGMLSAGTTLGGLASQEANLGLQNLQQQANLGNIQRGIEQEGIDALYKQYEQERLDPYKQIQFQQSLFEGLPLSTVTASTATSGLQDLNSLLSGVGGMYRAVDGLKLP